MFLLADSEASFLFIVARLWNNMQEAFNRGAQKESSGRLLPPPPPTSAASASPPTANVANCCPLLLSAAPDNHTAASGPETRCRNLPSSSHQHDGAPALLACIVMHRERLYTRRSLLYTDNPISDSLATYNKECGPHGQRAPVICADYQNKQKDRNATV